MARQLRPQSEKSYQCFFPNKTKYVSNQLNVNQNELLYWLYCSNFDVLLTSMVTKPYLLIKKLETKKKRWQVTNLSRSLKIKKLEKQISI